MTGYDGLAPGVPYDYARVVADRLAPHRPPSTLLGVVVLGYPDQLVEIDAVAALPDADR